MHKDARHNKMQQKMHCNPVVENTIQTAHNNRNMMLTVNTVVTLLDIALYKTVLTRII